MGHEAKSSYVFVEWTEASQYHGANYKRDQVEALLETLKARGIETVWIDEKEAKLT